MADHARDDEAGEHQVGELHKGEHPQQGTNNRDQPPAGGDRLAQQGHAKQQDHDHVHCVDVYGAKKEKIGVIARQPPAPEAPPEQPDDRGEDGAGRDLPDQVMRIMLARGRASEQVAKRTVGENEVRTELQVVAERIVERQPPRRIEAGRRQLGQPDEIQPEQRPEHGLTEKLEDGQAEARKAVGPRRGGGRGHEVVRLGKGRWNHQLDSIRSPLPVRRCGFVRWTLPSKARYASRAMSACRGSTRSRS